MNLLKAFKYLIKHPIDFFVKWGQGFKRLTAKDFSRAMYQGHAWGIVGLITGTGFVIVNGGVSRFFSIFLFSVIWIKIWEFRKAQKQYRALDEMEKKLKGVDKKC